VFDETTARSWPEIRCAAGEGTVGPKPKVYVKDAIANCAKYEKLNPHFAKVFKFMKRGDLATLKSGRYEIVPGKCWAFVGGGTNLVPLADRKIEVHRKFIDIHLPVSGPETIGVAEATDTDLAGMRGFDIDEDVGYLKATVEPMALSPGEFAILFPPRCLHAPGCLAGEAMFPHRKVVIKVVAE
jgi:YhcH/YjgK/YiaL family protein